MEMHSALAFWEGTGKNPLWEISLSKLALGLGQSAKEVSQDCSTPKWKRQHSAKSSKQLLLHLVFQITSFPLHLSNSGGILSLLLKMQEASRIPSLISVHWVFNWNHQERLHKGFLLFSIKLGFLPMPEVNDKTGSEQRSVNEKPSWKRFTAWHAAHSRETGLSPYRSE